MVPRQVARGISGYSKMKAAVFFAVGLLRLIFSAGGGERVSPAKILLHGDGGKSVP